MPDPTPAPPPTPPIVTEQNDTPPTIITPPQRPPLIPKKLVLVLGSIIGVLVVLNIIATIYRSTTKPNPNSNTLPNPSPSANSSPTPIPLITPISADVTPQPNRLSLRSIENKRLITAKDNTLYLFTFSSEGPSKKILAEFDESIIEIVPSPDSKNVAVTTTSTLTILPIANSNEKTQLVVTKDSLKPTSPSWSQDSQYLVFLNLSDSIVLFDINTKKRVLEYSSTPKLGVPKFVLNQAKIGFTADNNLIEIEYSGTKQTTIVTDVEPESTIYYSPESNSVVYSSISEDLLYFDKSRKTTKQLGENNAGQRLWSVIGFLQNNTFVFEDYANDTNPRQLMAYSPNQNQLITFFKNLQTPSTTTKTSITQSKRYLMTGKDGFIRLSQSGEVLNNCEFASLKFSKSSPEKPLHLYTADGEYIYSIESNVVASIKNCAISTTIDEQRYSQASWLVK